MKLGARSALFRFAAEVLTEIIGRPVFYRINRTLFLIALRGLGFNAAYGQPVSRPEKRFLRRYLPKVERFCAFDVGANCGDYAEFLMELRPNAVVHAFEPNINVWPRLLERSRRFGFIATRVGCGAKSEPASLYDLAVEGGTTFASLVPGAIQHASRATNRAIESGQAIELVSLDDYCGRAGIQRIDFLKIDTEGFEADVLRGAKNLIAQNKLGMVQLEFNYCNVYSRTFVVDFIDMLPQHRIYRLLFSGDLVPLENEIKFREIFSYNVLVAIPV